MTAFKETIVLPWFYGYYGSIWDSSEVDVSYEIDSINQERHANGLEGEVEYDDIEWNWDGYYAELNTAITSAVEQFVNWCGIECEFKFKQLDSPREYNFTNDEIIVDATFPKPIQLWRKIIQHKAAIEKYIKERFTSRDGFISFVSNDINEWREDYNNGDKHIPIYLWTVLEVILAEESKTALDEFCLEGDNEVMAASYVYAANYMELCEGTGEFEEKYAARKAAADGIYVVAYAERAPYGMELYTEIGRCESLSAAWNALMQFIDAHKSEFGIHEIVRGSWSDNLYDVDGERTVWIRWDSKDITVELGRSQTYEFDRFVFRIAKVERQ